MPSYFTPEFQHARRAAQIEAHCEGRHTVSPAHLLLAALDCSAAAPENEGETPTETAAARLLESVGIEPELVRLAIQSRLRACPEAASTPIPAEPKMSAAADRLIAHAPLVAHALGAHQTGTEHILRAAVRFRYLTMPFGFELAWQLNQWKVIPDSVVQALWRRAGPLSTIVPEVVAEFGLDYLLGEGPNPSGQTGPPWAKDLRQITERAQKVATASGAGRVGAEHLWLALLADPFIATLLQDRGIDSSRLESHLRSALRADGEIATAKIRYTPEVRRAFTAAQNLARAEGSPTVGLDHLLFALGGCGLSSIFAVEKPFRDSEPASRARPAIARALAEMGLPTDHLRMVHNGTDIVARKVAAIVATELQLPLESINASTLLPPASAFQPASLDLVQACASEFNIAITASEARTIRTAGRLTTVAMHKLSAQASSEAPVTSQTRLWAFVTPTLTWAIIGPLLFISVPGFELSMLVGTGFLQITLCIIALPFAVACYLSSRVRAVAGWFIAGWLMLCMLYFISPR